MNRVVFLFLVMSSFLINCTPSITRQISELPQNRLPLECKGLDSLVSKGFYYVKQYDYYIFHSETLNNSVIGNKECISKLKPNEVKQIFGQPHYENSKGIYYHLTHKIINKGFMPYSLIFYKEGDNIKSAEIYVYKK